MRLGDDGISIDEGSPNVRRRAGAAGIAATAQRRNVVFGSP